MSSSSKKLNYIDILNVLAAFAVIAMHVNLAYWNFRPAPSWVINTVIVKSLEWAVQVFYMITGATLIGYISRMSTAEYARRRIKHTLIPFFVWSLVILGLDMIVFGYVPFGNAPTYYMNLIFNTELPMGNAYWFFIPLFSIYLAIPVVTLIPEDKRIKAFSYLIFAYLLIKCAGEMLALFEINANPDLTMPLVGGWLLYPLAGYVLSRREFNKKERTALYAMGIVGWLTMLVGTIVLSFRDGVTVHAFSAGTDWPKAVQAAAVFVFIKQFAGNHPKIAELRFWRWCSGLTFGTYLVHMVVIQAVLTIFNINNASWWWSISGIPIVVILALGIVLALKRTPGIRKVL